MDEMSRRFSGGKVESWNRMQVSNSSNFQYHCSPERQRVGLPSVHHLAVSDAVLQGLVVQEVKQILRQKHWIFDLDLIQINFA